MTDTRQKNEAVERLADQLRGEGDAHFRGSIRDRRTIGAIMCDGGVTLRALLAERDQLQTRVERLEEALRFYGSSFAPGQDGGEKARAALTDFNKARGEW